MATYYRKRMHREVSYELYEYVVEAESPEEAQRIADEGNADVEHVKNLDVTESVPCDWEDDDEWEET